MHKIIISVLGAKGGASKTTTSHLMCHGLSKYMIRSVLLTTDHAAGRKSLDDKNRLYKTHSGQTDASLKSTFVKFETFDVSKYSAALIVDGGGNRSAVDDVLAKYSDIILLPFRDSEEDLRVVIEDMKRLPEAFALPSAWPTNSFASKHAEKALQEMEAKFPGRILQPVPACRATQKLLAEEYKDIDSMVTSISKNLAIDALSKIGIIP